MSILSLDWIDLAGTLKTACQGEAPAGKVIQVSVDQYVHNGWSMDYQGLPPADVYLLTEPEAAVPALLAEVRRICPSPPPLPAARERRGPPPLSALETASVIEVPLLATALKAALAGAPMLDDPIAAQLGRASVGFPAPARFSRCRWRRRHRIGAGMAVGAALALRDGDRLPVAMLGDGDFLMGVHRVVDGGAQQHPVACRDRQQPLVLQ